MPSVRQWQEDLSAQYLPFKFKGEKTAVRLSVRPVQLYEIGFPEDQLDTVMNMVGSSDYILKRYPVLDKMAKWMRKFLKLKPVPKPKKPFKIMQPNNTNKAVAVVPIGIKDDIKHSDFDML